MNYPMSYFRIGVGNTDNNIIGYSSSLYAAHPAGKLHEKWYLKYINPQIFIVINALYDLVLTANEQQVLLQNYIEDNENQLWSFQGVENDYDGYILYYKILNNNDNSKSLTFTNNAGFSLEEYSGKDYQKFKINLDGLEGFAANCMTSSGEKAGTIGGLFGPVVEVKTADDLVNEAKSEGPKTIFINGKIDMRTKWHTRIRDYKTIVGSFEENTLYDPWFRTNNEYGTVGDNPSDNIVIRNLDLQAINEKGRIMINIWASRQIWIDHISFESFLEYDRKGNGQDEVGKFIWLNTPYKNYMDAKDNNRSIDYITISYCKMTNRYWAVAYGTQNDEITRDRTTLLYNWWNKNVRRCPQLGNGILHVYNNYYSAYGESDNNRDTTGIIGGDGSEVVSQNNVFNGYTKGQALRMGGDVGKNPARDDDSYFCNELNEDFEKINFEPKTLSNWFPNISNYGYKLLDSNIENNIFNVKSFCINYAGCFYSQNEIKYITDEDFNEFDFINYESPFLEHIDFTPSVPSCHKIIKNCEKCISDTVCESCYPGYTLVDNNELCLETDSKKYYQDKSDENKNKSCYKYSNFENCDECEFNENDEFICLKCFIGYSFVYDEENKLNCLLLNSLPENKYFTEDEINYSLCEKYSNIENCIACSNKNKCTLCSNNDDYSLVNEGKLCLLNSEINNKKYYKSSANEYYYPCSNLFPGCITCTEETCLSCENNYFLVQNIANGPLSCLLDNEKNKKKYYLKSSNTFYKKCDNDGIENCDECNYSENSGNFDIKCTICNQKYVLVDEGIICGDPESKLYYIDSNDNNKYKSCNKKIQNCNECEINEGNVLCLKCEEDYAFFYDENDINKCIIKSSKNLDNFFTLDNIYYYPCNNKFYHNVEFCESCNKKEECISCINGYNIVNNNKLCINFSEKIYYLDNNLYYPCSINLDHCTKCESKTQCLECDFNFVLEENDICISKNLVEEKLYYLNTENNKYVSCSKNINNCKQCENGNYCIECENNLLNFEYYKDESTKKTKCEELNNVNIENYYYDTNENIYKLCKNYIPNCEKCELNNSNDLICEECALGYIFKHDENIQCVEKINIERDNKYFTNDTGLNYYSCNIYNNINNCIYCSNEETCEKCDSNYLLANNNTLCILESDITEKKYYHDSKLNIFTACSILINNCNKCTNNETCIKCEERFQIEQNDKCVSENLINENYYYKDEESNKYVNCGIIENCLTCTSETKCISCIEGFEIVDDKCQKIINQENDKLSTASIVGIVLGGVGFLSIASFLTYYFLRKLKISKKSNNNVAKTENEEKLGKEDKIEEIEENVGSLKQSSKEVIYKAKKIISNNKKIKN